MNGSPRRGLLGRLESIDPAGGEVRPRHSRNDPALHRIMDSPRTVIDGDFLPRQRTSRGLVAASVLIVLVLSVGTLLWGGGQPAYATWTERPQAVDAQRAAAAQAQCPMSSTGIDDGEPVQVELEPVLIDVRGDYTLIISSDGADALGVCFVTESDGDLFAVAVGGEGADGATLAALEQPDDASDVSIIGSGTAAWSEGAERLPGELTLAFGRTGSDVESVELDGVSNEDVEATVSGGWWAAWAPGEEAFDEAFTVVADGERTTHSLDE